jgi:8-amino-7-oxononanoate synthase
MGLKSRIVDRGKQLVQSPRVMRWVSDDRVMKAAEGVLDAKTRVRLAWHMLKNGHGLPHVDPALDDGLAETIDHDDLPNGRNGSKSNGSKSNGSSYASHGSNGSSSNGSSANGSSHSATNGGSANGASANGASAIGGSGSGHAAIGHASADGVQAVGDVEPALRVRRPSTYGARNGLERGMEDALRDRANLANVGGQDVFEKCYQFTTADNARKAGLYPFFRPLDFNDGPEAVIDGRRVLMFGSNNYLGLTTHPKVREAAKAAIDRFGTSMTGSRLVNGSMKLHNEFEAKLAAFFGKESALVFTTGYQVNLATCAAILSNKSSVAVVDRNVHASLYDGVSLGQSAGARLTR